VTGWKDEYIGCLKKRHLGEAADHPGKENAPNQTTFECKLP
jgi:hypothetical protein